MIINLSIIASSAAILLILLNKNFNIGLGFAVFLLVSMPVELFIETGGALPILSVYRAVIIVLLLTALFKKGMLASVANLPFMNLILLMVAARTLSLGLSTDIGLSFKPYLSFIIETVILYIVMANIIKHKGHIDFVLYGICAATVVVAIIGVVEKYTDFNPVDYIPIAGRLLSFRHEPANAGVVYSTYNHPILLGTGLAMGWPICLAVFDKRANTWRKNFLLWSSTCLIIACLYFTVSRGPWLAFILCGIILILLGYPKIIKRVIIVLIMTVIVLYAKPGVYDTINSLYQQTIDPYSLEGGSYRYRLELWKMAYKEISKSPERFAFGYGEGTIPSLGMVGTLSYGEVRDKEFRSWDNDLAAVLLETGFVGLAALLILFFSMLKFMLSAVKAVDREYRIVIHALIASLCAYIFMTTNVRMFAPQVSFLVWINLAVGVALYHGKYFRQNRRESRQYRHLPVRSERRLSNFAGRSIGKKRLYAIQEGPRR